MRLKSDLTQHAYNQYLDYLRPVRDSDEQMSLVTGQKSAITENETPKLEVRSSLTEIEPLTNLSGEAIRTKPEEVSKMGICPTLHLSFYESDYQNDTSERIQSDEDPSLSKNEYCGPKFFENTPSQSDALIDAALALASLNTGQDSKNNFLESVPISNLNISQDADEEMKEPCREYNYSCGAALLPTIDPSPGSEYFDRHLEYCQDLPLQLADHPSQNFAPNNYAQARRPGTLVDGSTQTDPWLGNSANGKPAPNLLFHCRVCGKGFSMVGLRNRHERTKVCIPKPRKPYTFTYRKRKSEEPSNKGKKGK